MPSSQVAQELIWQPTHSHQHSPHNCSCSWPCKTGNVSCTIGMLPGEEHTHTCLAVHSQPSLLPWLGYLLGFVRQSLHG